MDGDNTNLAQLHQLFKSSLRIWCACSIQEAWPASQNGNLSVFLDDSLNSQCFVCVTCGETSWIQTIFNWCFHMSELTKQFRSLCWPHSTGTRHCSEHFMHFWYSFPEYEEKFMQKSCTCKSTIKNPHLAFNMHHTKHPLRRNTQDDCCKTHYTDSEDSNNKPWNGSMLTCHSGSKWQVWKGFCTSIVSIT